MCEKLHLHEFDGVTNKILKHQHKYSGTSSKNPILKAIVIIFLDILWEE